ncbi:MAG: PorT family protein [Chitinophagales bacterium]|nr:PorT family protein [Chitinophagales bacterium]
MKKLAFVFLLLLTSLYTYAETVDSLSSNDRIRIYSGFRFGFGGAKQRNTVISGSDGKFAINPNMGAVLWLRFKEHLGLMIEANYSLKGIRFKNEIKGKTVSKDTVSVYQRKFHYMEFPILLHTSLGTNKFTEFLEVGIVPSYVAGAYDQKTYFVDKDPVYTESEAFDYRDKTQFPTNRFDMSILFGAGLGVKIGPGLLHAGIRTNIGLLDIYKTSRIGYINQNQRQFNFQIQFGYLWHVKSIR